MTKGKWGPRLAAIVMLAACDITVQDDAGAGLTAADEGGDGAATSGGGDGSNADEDDGVDDGAEGPVDGGDDGDDGAPMPGSDGPGDSGPEPGGTTGGPVGPGTGGGFETGDVPDPFDTDGFGTGIPDPFDTDGFGTGGFGTGAPEFCSFLEDEETCSFFGDECQWNAGEAACEPI